LLEFAQQRGYLATIECIHKAHARRLGQKFKSTNPKSADPAMALSRKVSSSANVACWLGDDAEFS